MANNIRDIKIRIESIKSTRQITNAMKMVAAAKLRKAQDKIINVRPYANHINEMIKRIKQKNRITQHPLLSEEEIKGIHAIVIVTADRGLCGSFNTNIIRKAIEYIAANPKAELICIGKKGYDYLKKNTDRIIKNYTGLFNEMNFSVSKDIASYLMDLFLNENYSKIEVLYNEFKSSIQHNIIAKQIFPILPEDQSETNYLDFIYEPDEKTIIDVLGKKYINVEIWRILLESSAAEQGARMTSMDSATDNATELIKQLTLQYNRARQAGITKEIIEIASGAEAINN